MFNDEIDRVRINAINSLRKMGHRVTLKENQLHIVLSALEDANEEVRICVHRFLSVLNHSNVVSLHATIQAILSNAIHRYPRDLESAYRTMRDLGVNHPSFSESLIVPLLQLDERFIPIETHLEDKHYVGCAIFLLNATQKNSRIIQKLPGYILKHYFYLKERYKDIIPNDVTISLNSTHDDVSQQLIVNTSNANDQMEKYYNKAVHTIEQMIISYNKIIYYDNKSREYNRVISQIKTHQFLIKRSGLRHQNVEKHEMERKILQKLL